MMTGDGWEFRFYPDSGFQNLAAMALELQACDMAYQIGGRVTVGVHISDRHAQVEVSDSGPGIMTSDLPHVFERFFRADQVRPARCVARVGESPVMVTP